MTETLQVVFDAQERRILVFASASHFLTHFFMLVFPALVIPISTDLGIPVASALALSFWMYLLYGLLALAWGYMSDRWGHRWAMSSGLVIGGIGLALAGIAHALCFFQPRLHSSESAHQPTIPQEPPSFRKGFANEDELLG
ncbi:MAG TPA: MFS transporter [Spirochaetia bacterium]|nr:MFS transporter [Spirochaetia bacterium]